ncbi:hypothetical protein ASG48_00660 [Aurantimonas sp. Leaf443]|nr:hypothetical protein ASG48_00660 [Aurantimonas sp. Leaf443]
MDRARGLSRLPLALAALLALLLALVGAGASARAGEIRSFAYPSPALGKAGVARVYVPSGPAPKDGWPVLYLLHGLGGNERDWEGLGRVGSTLDRMIAAGEIEPLLVVMPAAGNSWYTDSASVGGPGNYRTSILFDLPDAVEKAFPAATSGRWRAIAGLSMGGYGALSMGFQFPDRFRSIAALSPAVWHNVPAREFNWPAAELAAVRQSGYFHRYDEATVAGGINRPPEGTHFESAFGTPFDPKRFNAANVFTHLAAAIAAATPLPSTFVSVGDDDSHDLWRGAIALYQTMQADARAVEFRVTDGDHSWDVWRSSVVDALRFVDSRWPDEETPKTP